MQSFEQLIRGLLKRAGLQEETINRIWATPRYVQMFETAFVHKSYDSDAKRNYEKVENLGDLVLNMAIVNYVVRKHFDILSADWLANIKHRMISGVKFARIATRLGFFEHIKYGDKLVRVGQEFKSFSETLASEMASADDLIRDSKQYRSLLEDVFEAFCGTLQLIVNDLAGMDAGPGYAVCYEFIKSIIDETGVPLTQEEVFDPITTVKEIYDAQGWPSKAREQVLTRRLDDGKVQATYYVTEGRMRNTQSTRRILFGLGTAGEEKAARREAAKATLKILKQRYNIEHRTKKIS